eukprot:1269165-Prymnesium_polylepis.1
MPQYRTDTRPPFLSRHAGADQALPLFVRGARLWRARWTQLPELHATPALTTRVLALRLTFQRCSFDQHGGRGGGSRGVRGPRC